MTWKLVVSSTGQEAAEGETYHDFRGEPHVLKGGRPPHKSGSSGFVYISGGEFYPSVIGLEWVQE